MYKGEQNMNENFQIFQPMPHKNNCECRNEITNMINQINYLQQEIKRLENRILNIEKNMSLNNINHIKPTPIEYNNLAYTNDNYIL